MRITQGHMNLLAFNLGAVTDTVDVKHATKSLAHALRHVGDQFAREPMKRAYFTLLVVPGHVQDVALDRDPQTGGNRRFELALGPFEPDRAGVYDNLHAGRDRYGQLSNT